MTATTSTLRERVTLMNEAALSLPSESDADRSATGSGRCHLIVAGRSPERMALAEVALPGAQMIWTDFRQSASVGRLRGAIHTLGGLDRLVLAGDGDDDEAETAFSFMCAIVCFLPALRRRPGARVLVSLTDGAAAGSMRAFLARIGPRLAEDGISVDLSLRPGRQRANFV